jgi:hypothetical protein
MGVARRRPCPPGTTPFCFVFYFILFLVFSF